MQKIYSLYALFFVFVWGILGVGISNATCVSGNFYVLNPTVGVDCKFGICTGATAYPGTPFCSNTSLCSVGCSSLGIVNQDGFYYTAVGIHPVVDSDCISTSPTCGIAYNGGNYSTCKSTIRCTTLSEATTKRDSLTGNAVAKCTAWSCSVKDHIEYGSNSITGYKIATYTCTAGSSSMIGMTRSIKSGSCSSSGPSSTDSLVTEGPDKAQYQCNTSYSNGVPTAKTTCIGGACYTGGISISGSTCEDQGYKEGGGKNGDYSSSGASGSGSGSGTSIYQDSTIGTTGEDATGGSYRCVASIRDGVEYATFYYSDGSHSTVSGTCGNGNTANGTSTSPDAPDTVTTGAAAGQLDYSAYLTAIINNQLVQSSYLYTLNETSSGILGAITEQTLNNYSYFSGLNSSLNSANILQTTSNSLQTTTNNTLSTISGTLSSEKTKIDSVLIVDKQTNDSINKNFGDVETWLQTIHEDLLSFSMPSSSVQSSSSISSSSVQSSSSISSSSISSSSVESSSSISVIDSLVSDLSNKLDSNWKKIIGLETDQNSFISIIIDKLFGVDSNPLAPDSDTTFSDDDFFTGVDTSAVVPSDSFSTYADSILYLRDSLQARFDSLRSDSAKGDTLPLDTLLKDTSKYRQQFSFMFWSGATEANGTCFVLNLPLNSLPFLSSTAGQTQVDLGDLAGCNLCKIAGFILKLLTLLDVGFMYFFMFKNIFSNPL